MFFEVVNAEYQYDYCIQIEFADGNIGIVDLSKYPDRENVFKAFLDIDYFRNFRIEYGTLVWGDGEIDIAPETLYTLATGKPITFTQQQHSI